MQLQIICVVVLTLSVSAIRVPVDEIDEQSLDEDVKNVDSREPVYYTSIEGHVDSYLHPPDPQQTEETYDTPDAGEGKLSTYLKPPSQDNLAFDYYFNSPSKNHEQTDWLPITKGPLPTIPTTHVYEGAKRLNISDYLIVNNPVVVPPELLTKERVQSAFENLESESPPHEKGILVVKRIKHPIHMPSDPLKTDFEAVPVPSRKLEPPSFGAIDEYSLSHPLKYDFSSAFPPVILTPAPSAKIVFDPNLQKKVALNFEHSGNRPRTALNLRPPKKKTSLYPKKYTPFQTVPIPIGPFAEIPHHSVEMRPLENFMAVGQKFVGRQHHTIYKSKPSKSFLPYTSHSLPALDGDKINFYKQQEEERNSPPKMDKAESSVTEANEEKVTPEQVPSETNFDHPGGHRHQALIKPIGKSGTYTAAAIPPNERTEFRMHGIKGPHSYQFGYDTGKGKNRQFRYEERDNDGHVRGHYGYMDRHGKLRVVNYDADPKLGFRAEAPTDAEQP